MDEEAAVGFIPTTIKEVMFLPAGRNGKRRLHIRTSLCDGEPIRVKESKLVACKKLKKGKPVEVYFDCEGTGANNILAIKFGKTICFQRA